MKVIPFVRFSLYYTSYTGRKHFEGYTLLRPGHIILTVDRKKLTSLLIPGTMTHAALCVAKASDDLGKVYNDADFFEVAEMTHKNYTKSWWFDICKESDRVVILNCNDWDVDFRHKVIAHCKQLTGAKYDVIFQLGVEALYCSELIYECDRRATEAEGRSSMFHQTRLKVDLSDLAGLGREYISPDGLLFAENVTCVFDSDDMFTGLTGPQIETLILKLAK